MLTTFNRVIELNAGIICSCMPVLPILVKRVTESDSCRKTISALRHFKFTADSDDGNCAALKDGGASPKLSLSIPKPTMSGLRTMIRGGSRVNQSLGEESFAHLDSFSDEYHAQLKSTSR
jgi:hypothetical protein